MLRAPTTARSSAPMPGAVPGSVSVSIRRTLTAVGGRRCGAGAVEPAHRLVDAVATTSVHSAPRSTSASTSSPPRTAAAPSRPRAGARPARAGRRRSARARSRPCPARAQRAQAVVAGQPAAQLRAHVAELQVDLVVHDDQRIRARACRSASPPRRCGRDRFMNVCGWSSASRTSPSRASATRPENLLRHDAAPLRRQPVGDHEAEVVARGGVLRPGVSEPDHEQVERRAEVAPPQAHPRAPPTRRSLGSRPRPALAALAAPPRPLRRPRRAHASASASARLRLELGLGLELVLGHRRRDRGEDRCPRGRR